MTGDDILEGAKNHVLAAMARMPECKSADGTGAGSPTIEEVAQLDLGLKAQNGWFTWSLLMSLLQDGLIETVPNRGRRKFRLRLGPNRVG
jgi:hypothetical protein